MLTAVSPPIPVEDVSMSDRKPDSESNVLAIPGADVAAPAPVRRLSDDLGPDDPEAQGSWKIPLGPIDDIVAKQEALPEPVAAGHGGGLLHRITHRG
jgi:hypothetical protein